MCNHHVMCRGFATSTSLPCRHRGKNMVNDEFLCIFHELPRQPNPATTPARHPNPVATPARHPNPESDDSSSTVATVPNRNMYDSIVHSQPTTMAPASTPAEQRLTEMENTVATVLDLVSQMAEQINELTLTVRSPQGSPTGPFSRQRNH